MSELFPPPDMPGEAREIMVLGAAVTRVRFDVGWAAFSLVVLEQEKPIGFRFCIPSHKRFVRDFLKAGKIKETPREGAVDVEDGLFLIKFKGNVIGQDNVPEGMPDSFPKELHVLGPDITVQVV